MKNLIYYSSDIVIDMSKVTYFTKQGVDKIVLDLDNGHQITNSFDSQELRDAEFARLQKLYLEANGAEVSE